MGSILLMDFGSTYTKVTLADPVRGEIVGTAKSHTTAASNIMLGLNEALAKFGMKGPFEKKLACSSAAGGLKMVAVGLVNDLTAEAARRAALGAGARVLEVFSYELTEADLEKIAALGPDILLLAGGTDGGNKEFMLKNARTLARLQMSLPVVVAGNRVAAPEAAEILRSRHSPVVVSGNVMPELNILRVEEARQVIRELFLKQIVKAKGLDLAEEFAGQVLMPTPAAVLKAAELLARGYGDEPGLGELMVVDVGGATTDVHSIAAGDLSKPGVSLKGLPEPYAKRTVEGDLGMRYSSLALLEAAGRRLTGYLGTGEASLRQYLENLAHSPDYLAQTEEEKKIDTGLGRLAVEIAVERHCGSLEVIYTPFGASYIQHGKDLTPLKTVIGTGGVLAGNPAALEILQGACFAPTSPTLLKPREPWYYLDSSYIMAGMGLLAESDPLAALRIMKKYITRLGGEDKYGS